MYVALTYLHLPKFKQSKLDGRRVNLSKLYFENKAEIIDWQTVNGFTLQFKVLITYRVEK